MIKGNINKFRGRGYVCFLDILGYSDDVIANWNNPENDPVAKLSAVKNKITLSNELENTEKRHDKHFVYVSRVNVIADTFIICFGLDAKPIYGDMLLGLESLIGNVFHVWKNLIREGYTARGVLDFGDIYWKDDVVIGPAIINACRLESDVAKTSRIIISSDLNKVLKDLVTQFDSGCRDHLIRNFRKDVDGYIILNPSLLADDDVERQNLIIKLNSLKSAVSNKIVKEKYTPLISMLSETDVVPLGVNAFGLY